MQIVYVYTYTVCMYVCVFNIFVAKQKYISISIATSDETLVAVTSLIGRRKYMFFTTVNMLSFENGCIAILKPVFSPEHQRGPYLYHTNTKGIF